MRLSRPFNFDFRIFSCVALSSNLFYALCMPETKGKSLLQIKHIFARVEQAALSPLNILVPSENLATPNPVKSSQQKEDRNSNIIST